ncbi:MAG: tRNA (guanosine(37)-N1)-methyltransferase TrmD [Candidatus Levybacteria bacterium]|nr:tRNA (guanosine(37)-N1)-methyltransferase TrmD [Candidatus Levybacteria bacterium]
MKISILTLFPQMFVGPFTESIVKRAQEKGIVVIELLDIREFGIGAHKMVDDTPAGGGIGMVLKVDVVHQAIEQAKANYSSTEVKRSGEAGGKVLDSARTIKRKILLTSAGGKTYKQKHAKEYSQLDHLILICGHYEGVDARIMKYIDGEVSIGDFVLTGGEIPSMLITDSIVRLIAGVITEGATEDESFSQSAQAMLEYPHYTRPREYDGQEIPEVLLNGDHKKIAAWRHEKALEKTRKFRPDLLQEKTIS